MGAVPLQSLDVGTAWSWTGDAVRVDGPNGLLRLDEADGDASIRKRAAKMVRKLVGAALSDETNLDNIEIDHPIRDSSFVVTDGAQSYTLTVIDVAGSKAPLLMFRQRTWIYGWFTIPLIFAGKIWCLYHRAV